MSDRVAAFAAFEAALDKRVPMETMVAAFNIAWWAGYKAGESS